jgi:hypothetical protein
MNEAPNWAASLVLRSDAMCAAVWAAPASVVIIARTAKAENANVAAAEMNVIDLNIVDHYLRAHGASAAQIR